MLGRTQRMHLILAHFPAINFPAIANRSCSCIESRMHEVLLQGFPETQCKVSQAVCLLHTPEYMQKPHLIFRIQ